jgi:hypothetical protein
MKCWDTLRSGLARKDTKPAGVADRFSVQANEKAQIIWYNRDESGRGNNTRKTWSVLTPQTLTIWPPFCETSVSTNRGCTGFAGEGATTVGVLAFGGLAVAVAVAVCASFVGEEVGDAFVGDGVGVGVGDGVAVGVGEGVDVGTDGCGVAVATVPLGIGVDVAVRVGAAAVAVGVGGTAAGVRVDGAWE